MSITNHNKGIRKDQGVKAYGVGIIILIMSTETIQVKEKGIKRESDGMSLNQTKPN